jgi:SAM-dependent methyltransferase
LASEGGIGSLFISQQIGRSAALTIAAPAAITPAHDGREKDDPVSGDHIIFDRAMARQRLQRAAKDGFAGFLVERAAADLAERLEPISRVFPIAVDIGTATADASDVLRRSGKIEHVIRAAPAMGLSGPSQIVINEEALPFADASLDCVTSLLAMQGLNDLPGALIQIRRALKPDGLFIGCLLGGATLHELRAAFVEAESQIEGGVSPRVAPFADVRDMGGLLQRAGFALPVADIERVIVRYAHPLRLFADLRAMGLTNVLTGRRRTPLRRDTLDRTLAIYCERHADPDGKVRATFEMVWLSGWAPHASQQQPLKPGSAKARLADALKAIEVSTGEKAGG